MSDHTWAAEHIEAFVAGGLTAAESERLEAHVRECAACAEALASTRRLDAALGSLFTGARPGPGFEDRVIQAVRTERTRELMLAGWKRKLTVGVAASVGLGLVGASASRLAEMGDLPIPGSLDSGRVAARTIKESQDDVRAAKAPGQGASNDLKTQNESLSGKLGASAVAQEVADRALSRFGEVSRGESNFGLKTNDTTAPPPASSTNSPPANPTRMDSNGATPPLFSFYTGQFGDGHGVSSSPAPTDGTSNTLGWAESNKREAQGKNSFHEPVDFPSTLRPSGNDYFLPTQSKPSSQLNMIAGGTWTYKTPPPVTPGNPVAIGTATEQAPAKNPAPAATDSTQPPAAARKIVIRSGDIEFEVDSFDSAVATVTRLVTAINGAYISTVNSDKLPNGKVKGSVVVRVPPDHLDALVLDLRKELGKSGELKGQRIGSQDITKQYTDLESRLKAARTMEQRLLQIIKEGKGEIKQLLEAEKELGNWRTKIEEFEGELRYYGNLVSLSTLTITLAEKDIRAAAGLIENERVQTGIEVEDVEKASQQARAAVEEAKGRVTKSEVKQLAAGQFNATLNFEVAPDAAGPVRDRLRQLGRVARLEIDRVQTPQGEGVQKDARVHRGDTIFFVQFYNLANIAPRETDTLSVAVPDVPAGYREIQEVVTRAKGRVITARLDEQDRQNVTAQFDFEVRRAEEGAVRSALAAAGEVISRNVARTPEGENVTDAKVLFRTALVGAARLKPRETMTLALEVADVDATAAVYGAQVAEVKGRQVDVQVAHERSGRVTARLVYDVPLAAASGLVERFKAAGTVRVQQSARDPQAPDGKYATARLDVTLSNSDLIVPPDDGVWTQIRKGLSYSVSVLLVSVTWVVFGLCVVLPWVVVGYGGYRLARRVFHTTPGAPPPASTAHG